MLRKFIGFFKNDEITPVDDQITSVLLRMQGIGVSHEDYTKMMTYLERLYEIKAKERRAPVSRDTIALIAGNLMGLLLIVAYEQKHVWASKGLSQVIHPR